MKPEYWNMVRAGYRELLPEILKASEDRKRGRVNPYFMDWSQSFTPIEESAWMSIRSVGVPLYPQFPALDYFIDFASPYFRIGLELDGKQFHDPVRDRVRDQRLFDEEGWRIFRATGSESYVKFQVPEDFEAWQEESHEYKDALRHWLMNTADGLIRSIHLVYFMDQRDAFGGMCLEALHTHRLVQDYDL